MESKLNWRLFLGKSSISFSTPHVYIFFWLVNIHFFEKDIGGVRLQLMGISLHSFHVHGHASVQDILKGFYTQNYHLEQSLWSLAIRGHHNGGTPTFVVTYYFKGERLGKTGNI